MKMKICAQPNEIVERYQMAFMNEVRSCEFLKALPKMTVGGKEIGPFEVGQQASLPNWVLERFLMDNIVEIAPEDSYESMVRLQTHYRGENKHPRLQELPPLLYAALSKKMHRLQSDKTSLDPRLHEDIERIETMIKVMIDTRLSKILRAAKSGMYQDKRKQMTFEERWLCDEIAGLLSAWREEVLKSL
ncbi:MAG: hypothetical protein RTU92_00565 [Candidatus Thorarchaeota archaeon]